MKVDSKGWKALAKTVRPLARKSPGRPGPGGRLVRLADGPAVETYPSWACSVVSKQEQIEVAKRQSFRETVLQVKRPGALAGRPQLAEVAADPSLKRR